MNTKAEVRIYDQLNCEVIEYSDDIKLRPGYELQIRSPNGSIAFHGAYSTKQQEWVTIISIPVPMGVLDRKETTMNLPESYTCLHCFTTNKLVSMHSRYCSCCNRVDEDVLRLVKSINRINRVNDLVKSKEIQ